MLPVLAGCLALTLVAATLLTVFTARQPTAGLRPQRPATGTRAPAQPGKALAGTILFEAGQATPLSNLPGRRRPAGIGVLVTQGGTRDHHPGCRQGHIEPASSRRAACAHAGLHLFQIG